MRYTLFIGEDCHQCAEVVDYIEKNDINCRKVNVDFSDEEAPVQIFAFPALFEDNELIGYGSDIINYLNKKSHTE